MLSPLYWAVIVCVPTGSVPMLTAPAPEARVAVPSGVDAPNKVGLWREKSTCPVGAVNPAGTLAAPTLTVKVTACPNTGLAGDAAVL